MPKYYRRRRTTFKRRTFKRRRTFGRRKTSYRFKKSIPNGKGGWFKTKYTGTFALESDAGSGIASTRASLGIMHWATNGSTTASGKFVTPAKVQAAEQLRDQQLFKERRITGVGIKVMFAEQNPTISQSIGYWQMWSLPSPDNELPDGITPAQVDQCKSLQTGAVPHNRTLSRYFKTYNSLKRKGVMWDECPQSGELASASWDYFGQVNPASTPASECPSPATYLRIEGTASNAALPGNIALAHVRVTYYMAYRGSRNL